MPNYRSQDFDVVFKDLFSVLQKIANHDPYTAMHCIQVALHADYYCDAVNITQNEKKGIIAAALVHDYGKIHVSSDILNKKESLTDDEYDIIKTHVNYEEEIRDEFDKLGLPYFSDDIIKGIIHHHVTENGEKSYPANVESINNFAKIIHAIDVFDALASQRPYKDGFDPNNIYKNIQKDEDKFETSVMNRFLIETPIENHAIVCEIATEIIKGIVPTYKPPTPVLTYNNKKIANSLDDIISLYSTSNTAISINNSSIYKYLRNNIKSLESIDTSELCDALLQVSMLTLDKKIYIEVDPDVNVEEKKVINFNGFKFAFITSDLLERNAGQHLEMFFSKALNEYCYSSKNGTMTGTEFINETSK